MNVASLELCKTLFELSGWISADLDGHYDVSNRGQFDKRTLYVAPAYDLGYLLRKLPRFFVAEGLHYVGDHKSNGFDLELDFSEPDYAFFYSNGEESLYFSQAETPEDAAAKLAIELFKQGILGTAEGKGK